MTELRVLTVRQPWASLIALGHKRIEVRTRPTKYRGWVAIHAAKADTDRTILDPQIAPAWDKLGEHIGGNAPTRGAIVGVARITDSLPIIDEERGWTGEGDTPDDVILVGRCLRELDRYDVSVGYTADLADQLPYAPADMWTPGHHAWMLDDVRPLVQPIPHKGGLGLRYATLDLAQRLAPYCADQPMGAPA